MAIHSESLKNSKGGGCKSGQHKTDWTFLFSLQNKTVSAVTINYGKTQVKISTRRKCIIFRYFSTVQFRGVSPPKIWSKTSINHSCVTYQVDNVLNVIFGLFYPQSVVPEKGQHDDDKFLKSIHPLKYMKKVPVQEL